MLYHVSAKVRSHSLSQFNSLLQNGSIARQEPDGEEIIASMKTAVVVQGDQVEWYETCFCNPPLQHERETVYDRFFSEITIEPATIHRTELKGESFWNRLMKTESYLQNHNSFSNAPTKTSKHFPTSTRLI